MTLNHGQDLLHTSVVVLQDTKPEANETFSVVLKDPTGGVEIGPDNRITVNILSNDNAYGIIEIAPVRFCLFCMYGCMCECVFA